MKKIIIIIMILIFPVNVFAQVSTTIIQKNETKSNTFEFAPEGVPANPTVFDVVAAAQNMGINSLNIQSLSNFLILNEDEFTSDDYAAFIATFYAIREAIIDDHVAELYPGKTAGSLTEEQRYVLFNSLNCDEFEAIIATFINLANAHRILFTLDNDAEGYPVFYGSMRHSLMLTSTNIPKQKTSIYNGAHTFKINYNDKYNHGFSTTSSNVDAYGWCSILSASSTASIALSELPVLEENGKIFLGWSFYDTSKQIITSDYTTSYTGGNMTIDLYSVWADDQNNNQIDDETENHYTITYKVDGETFKKFDNILVDLETPVPTEQPTKEGYDFIGWGEISSKVTKNTEYNAQWREDKNNNDIEDSEEEHYSVTYKVDNEIFKEYKDILLDTETPIPDEVPEKKGYIFESWGTIEEKVTKNTEYIAQWKEHEHNYVELLKDENGIYHICECGKKEQIVSFEKNTSENDENKTEGALIFNENLDIGMFDIKYMKLNENNEYEELSEKPSDSGKYKVILTIDGVSEELEYEIIDKVENPYTSDKPSLRYIFLLAYAVLIIGVYALYNKKIKKQHYEI